MAGHAESSPDERHDQAGPAIGDGTGPPEHPAAHGPGPPDHPHRHRHRHRQETAPQATAYEWPRSSVGASGSAGTEPESRAGRNGYSSTWIVSSACGAGFGGFGITAASECPPHP